MAANALQKIRNIALDLILSGSRFNLGLILTRDGKPTPLTEDHFAGLGGGSTDTGSAREDTLQEVVNRLPPGAGAPLGFEVLTLGAAAQGLANIPPGAYLARAFLRGAAASTAVAGPDPTPEAGDYWPDLSGWELSRDELEVFKAAAVSGSPKLRVTYYAEAGAPAPVEVQ